MEHFTIPPISVPDGQEQVLLHACCAPCSTAIIEACVHSGIRPTVYFYNPNIYPETEYLLRKNECVRFCEAMGLDYIDGDYDTKAWKKHTAGYEQEPERGKRCQLCFDLRLASSAKTAAEHGFSLFATTLSSSRWKDLAQITRAGEQAADSYPGVSYWLQDWRKKGLAARKDFLVRQSDFYQQEYCGCFYSLRDSNLWRQKNNKPLIQR
ncbi:hypothetical protein NFHSH190041_23120 [Shewanella sp. NFH-SH190041]|uniref:epoxyqueuosine reductase QueH n=1 Tax=Shewanella sp. NFH-SH190041 TaxID=2950245 RepID=UPI0021C475CE|nr:epoxyqueuosine reductase QueH [Shewanella sp. NFH-SH190041]BDM64860.1 hypothetical protein NFHSH190041_23120 [Shewanella sp. NFH-SH190041]